MFKTPGPVSAVSIGGQLLVTLQGDMPDNTLARLLNDLGTALEESPVDKVLVELSSFRVMDSVIASWFMELNERVEDGGATLFLVALKPALRTVAGELGSALDGLHHVSTIDEGLAA